MARGRSGLASHSSRSIATSASGSCSRSRISALRRTTAKSPGVRVVSAASPAGGASRRSNLPPTGRSGSRNFAGTAFRASSSEHQREWLSECQRAAERTYTRPAKPLPEPPNSGSIHECNRNVALDGAFRVPSSPLRRIWSTDSTKNATSHPREESAMCHRIRRVYPKAGNCSNEAKRIPALVGEKRVRLRITQGR